MKHIVNISMSRAAALPYLLVLALTVGCASSRPATTGSDQSRVEAARAAYAAGDYGETVRSLQEFLSDNPGTRYREEALFLMARAYYEDGLFFEAEERFRRVLRDFPGGDHAPEASYFLSLALLSQSRSPALDQTETRHALTQMKSFISRYPDHPLVERAQGHILAMREKLGEKQMKTACFYHRRGKPFSRAARFYLEEKVLKEYGDTRWGPEAMLKLAENYARTEEWTEAAAWAGRLVETAGESKAAEEGRRILARAQREIDEGQSAAEDSRDGAAVDRAGTSPISPR